MAQSARQSNVTDLGAYSIAAVNSTVPMWMDDITTWMDLAVVTCSLIIGLLTAILTIDRFIKRFFPKRK